MPQDPTTGDAEHATPKTNGPHAVPGAGERSLQYWSPQPLPGILEDLPPMPMPMPSEALAAVTERLKQLREVTIPDWLESEPISEELYALAVTLDTWTILVDMIRGALVRKAILR